jgi:transcriptional regulatory protein RtcR
MLLKAIEEKRFYPVGADREVTSDFQLVAGSNRDLTAEVAAGRFREDLLARLSLWVFELPPLRARPEDLAPNLEYELDRLGVELGHPVALGSAARAAFLRFAATAPWRANFRDFNAAIRRMVTLADGGRVDERGVDGELARLHVSWRGGGGARAATARERGDPERGASGWGELLRTVLGERADRLDRFDRVQLAEVVRACATAPSLSAAGRELFAQSRQGKTSRNDADRLRKYLARFELSFEEVKARAGRGAPAE